MLTGIEREEVMARIHKELDVQCIGFSNITDEPERVCSKRRKILKFDEWEDIGLLDKSSGSVVCKEVEDYRKDSTSNRSNKPCIPSTSSGSGASED
ncbi:hypothetical protein Anas_09247 [Armadillidium nasatum]|uniref:Uncharacterized protein n=1 Tax=Armadillidium nasatum TaxID=96803 RepID=A0A5N5TL02_9CRUS|nr:hypothetical protein Anas_09247 [Armadillidium nasatum]